MDNQAASRMTLIPRCGMPDVAGMIFAKPVALRGACGSPAQRSAPCLFARLSNNKQGGHPTVAMTICNLPFLSRSASVHTLVAICPQRKSYMVFYSSLCT